MDRNSVVGLVLIGVILLAWSYFMAPTEEEIAEQKRIQDSIAQVEEAARAKAEKARLDSVVAATDSSRPTSIEIDTLDSARVAEEQAQHGELYSVLSGEASLTTFETDLLKLTISSKGAYPVRCELKNYKTYDSSALYLFDKDSSLLAFDFVFNGRNYSTNQLYFEPQFEGTSANSEGDSLRVNYRAYLADRSRYIEFAYLLRAGDYMVDFDINFVGLADVLAENNNTLMAKWNLASLAKEKGIRQERATTSVYWRTVSKDVDYISESNYSVENEFEEPLHWVSFKQQFFSVAWMADDRFLPENTSIATVSTEDSERYVEAMETRIAVPFNNGLAATTFFLGPNKYNLLHGYDNGLEDQINLGWGIFGWVNKYFVIQVFDFLEDFNINYGIIILILTLLIKGILFPFTYKTYLSSAKQKVLKPEMEALNEKFKDAEPMKKQQATMKLYQEAGVNPLAGCVPMLIQFPILYAMFRFFPASIELRQKSFLWAEDLSTYDAIVSWSTEIPIISSVYGNHVSLFTLLMSISTFFYTRYNSSMTMAQGPQAQQMKIIMYLMPVMLLGFFNNYASGLSLYYFAANLITIIQQLVIKRFIIDEDAIHAKIKANIENPNKKKSRFQRKMDAMMKQQQQANRNKKK